jgi:hypothetical protein
MYIINNKYLVNLDEDKYVNVRDLDCHNTEYK